MNAPAIASTEAALATIADAPCAAVDPNELARQYLPLVQRLARKAYRHFGGHVDYDELVALGSEGLVEASRRYDPAAGASFKTFAYYRIRGAMFDGVGSVGPVPRSVYRRRHEPRCELTVRRTQLEPMELCDAADVEADLQRAQIRALLERVIAELPASEQHLVRACYFEGKTLLDAGKDIGISKSWASRMHGKVLAKLRCALAELDVELLAH